MKVYPVSGTVLPSCTTFYCTIRLPSCTTVVCTPQCILFMYVHRSLIFQILSKHNNFDLQFQHRTWATHTPLFSSNFCSFDHYHPRNTDVKQKDGVDRQYPSFFLYHCTHKHNRSPCGPYITDCTNNDAEQPVGHKETQH